MFTKLMFVFILIPALEIYVLLSVGSLIGLWPSIGLILATGIAGAALARQQGITLLMEIRDELQAGRMPTDRLVDGALVLAGALLLLTPGFCTDLIGFIMLAPFSRVPLRRWLQDYFNRALATGRIQVRPW